MTSNRTDPSDPTIRPDPRRLLDCLPAAVVLLDGAGRVRFCNPAARRLLGNDLQDSLWRDRIVRDFAPRRDDGRQVSLRDGRRLTIATAALGGFGQVLLLTEVPGDPGVADYLPRPFEPDTVLNDMGAGSDASPVAEDPRSRELMDLLQRVAVSEATVLIGGESGTGKEVLARSLHRRSRRSDGPFVALNCAAIPENLLEATLFGYEKGAFTGAVKSMPGKFEQAQGGTLLLDEISEMDLALQAKLLRVLQERQVERLGDRRTLDLDVRVLATTNRDLTEAVARGRFREDLYYRINVFPLHNPPLRERRGDILPLARRFVGHLARQSGRAVPALSHQARDLLYHHDWPGNVRELENLMQRALILQAGPLIGPSDLRFGAGPSARPAPSGDLRGRERDLIIDTLRRVAGNRQAAAHRLGISPRTLRYKLARLREAGVEIPAPVRGLPA